MEKIMYNGQFLKVTEEKIGDNIWERVYLKNGVQVFPMTKDNKFYLIEEKRPHENKGVRLKFVTGLMDKENEDPLETANREMQEEIGFKASHLEVINQKITSGTVNNIFYQVFATGLTPSKIPNPDGEDTIVSIKTYSIEEIFQLLEENKLPWDMSIVALTKIKKLLEKSKT